MSEKVDKSEPKSVIPAKAPFGATILWGAKGAGKTLACLNSPWQPVHIVDTEASSEVYFEHQKRLVSMGIIRGEFTRTACSSADDVLAEFTRFNKGNLHFGTLAIDTGGQWSEWVALQIQKRDASKMEKQSQIVWGSIRSVLRGYLISLAKYCDCLLLTAHEREYNHVKSPRCNPALLEIMSMSIRLNRPDKNILIPDAQFYATRLPFFPPQIKQFTIAKLLPYFEKPADWNKLEEDNKIPAEPTEQNEPPEE